ncbi:glycosyl transferase family protein [Sphingomonadaceae bacterium]|nr:glycosyl transferase family protein [Sphingomonadaceae bacterium]
MGDWHFTPWQWLLLAENELLLFAGFFFLIGAIDEFAVDLCWLWLKVTGKARTPRSSSPVGGEPQLSGLAAVFIPTWQEAPVIGATVSHALGVWPQRDLRIYVGCYRNDMATAEAVMASCNNDPRLRIVIHDLAGPSTKADCLNRLYRALQDDEQRSGTKARMVVLHDAEDMVDPAALRLMDRALDDAELVQIPVRAERQANSRWVAGHYLDEFAESHAKNMVVRDALGAGLPSAGVGCAISRPVLADLAMRRGQAMPFAADCLTEDYELGLDIGEMGLREKFLRVRHSDGRLVATRACFPAEIDQAVRQKTRWIHGIALQGWDRMGWSGNIVEFWMRMRDRRGPLTALVLMAGYTLLLLAAVQWLGHLAGRTEYLRMDPLLIGLLYVNLASLIWRLLFRFGFTAREYGLAEGLLAMPRIFVANFIAIAAGRRAFVAYMRTLAGGQIRWDKTSHDAHPVHALRAGQAA